MEKGRIGGYKKYILILGVLFIGVVACVSIRWFDRGRETGILNVRVEDEERITFAVEVYRSAYEYITKEKSTDSLTIVQNLVNALGENGFPAVDCHNQVDMAKHEQVRQFCDCVDNQQSDQLVLAVVSDRGALTIYDLRTEDGTVNVSCEFWQYEDGQMKDMGSGSFLADFWKYTEDGYLLFSGSYFSEELYVLSVSDAEVDVALRVEPLDETCRELNRKYVQSVGYEKNNLFLCDWSEGDFGEVNFYDLFDIFYTKVYSNTNTEINTYAADDLTDQDTIYEIPQAEFEQVLMTYFQIDSETLHSKTTYFEENETYGYRPRGFDDVEYSEIPYPEVEAYRENDDGTITLTVHAVYPQGYSSRLFVHEVVVRIMEDGSYQYVSNRVTIPPDKDAMWWHTDRRCMDVSQDQTAELSENEENDLWFLPQADDSLFTDNEKEALEQQALAAAKQIKEIYKDIKVTDGPSYASNITNFSDEQCKEGVKFLGEAGYASITEDCNMEHPEQLEQFFTDYQNGKDTQVTIFEVNRDGFLGATTFLYREKRLQTYYVGIGWQEGGVPEQRDTLVSDVKEIRLTEKGWFIYAYEDRMLHESMRQSWRMKPLSDKCRELTRKYVNGLSYVNYNALVTDWDSSNVEDILMLCMFEDLYRIHTGKNFRVKGNRIPADLFEPIMTTYFPVSKERLRKACGYDADSASYPYEMIYGSPYPPFGEVINYEEHANGTITLIVDAVWADYDSDCAFTNYLTIQPHADGTWCYLSNSIEQKELELPPVADIVE